MFPVSVTTSPCNQIRDTLKIRRPRERSAVGGRINDLFSQPISRSRTDGAVRQMKSILRPRESKGETSPLRRIVHRIFGSRFRGPRISRVTSCALFCGAGIFRPLLCLADRHRCPRRFPGSNRCPDASTIFAKFSGTRFTWKVLSMLSDLPWEALFSLFRSQPPWHGSARDSSFRQSARCRLSCFCQ